MQYIIQRNPVLLVNRKTYKKILGGKKRVENGMEKGWAVYARRGLNRGGTASWKGNIGARTMELWLV